MVFDLSVFDWNALTAFSTVAIAIAGFFINAKIKKSQEKSERYALLVQYRREIIEYSAEFFEISAAAVAECEAAISGKADNRALLSISSQLSALVDKGRYIFPNYIDQENYGAVKGPAFEGYRREPLDAILACYFALESVRVNSGKEGMMVNSLLELVKTGQPFSDQFNRHDPKSLIIESRRCYLNSTVPSTFPRHWRSEFSSLLGKVTAPITDEDAIKKIERI